ncbi:MAG: ribose-5-phosphate isomerase RpiA [Hyphomicrobiales bacterium]|nr:ribose-5-phosphate isomerase RpiA [Hyphomicrobiales bacterium]MDE2017086.1 ribose-5-phosphate isomerase RpiA [Hyphomicrobiales bacterium]
MDAAGSRREDWKREAAARALGFVEHGMKLGLGSGSTVDVFVDLLGQRVRDGLDVVATPASEATRARAGRNGVRLAEIDALGALDLCVDGADEVDPDLRLIKGGGGALLREKIVAASSARFVVIADSSKRVARLGKFPLPVEVASFGARTTMARVSRALAGLGLPGATRIRAAADGHDFVTDNGNRIVDCALGAIPEPERLAAALSEIPGVAGHGLFIGMTALAVFAGPEGATLQEPGEKPARA